MAEKEKTIFVDDGRTIADMSQVSGGLGRGFGTGTASSPREIWRTYWSATKMMLLPLLVAAAGIGVIYLVMYFLFSLAY